MKNYKKLLAILITVIMTVGLLAGCGSKAKDTSAGSGSTTKKKRIGISLVYKGDEWCAAVADNFAKQAEKYGFEVNVQDGNLDNETQTKQIENFITQQYDLIMVDPMSSDGIVPAVEKAKAANIPVLTFDQTANCDGLVSYVSWDSYQTGKIIGDYLHEKIKTKMNGKANVVLLTMASPASIAERIKGVKDALADLDIKYVASQEYEGNREKAANVVTNIKEPFDFVIAGQDNGAWGGVSACASLKKTNVECYSMGGYGKECFEALQKGNTNYKGSVAVSPSELVKVCYETATQYLQGKKDLEKRININLDLINTENINDYLAKNK